MIPIKVSCVPFSGLKALRYASGATPFLSMLSETKIIKNYSSLGISSNFLMNVNILLVLLLIIPLVYFPMKFKANASQDRHVRACNLKYGKAMLF